MYNQLVTKKHFQKPRLSNMAFIVKHYIDDVTYQVNGFLEKNKDSIYEEHLVMLRASIVPLVVQIFEDKSAKSKTTASTANKEANRASVGLQFQNSLR